MLRNRYFVENAITMSSIQAKKLELLEWLVTLQDKALIEELMKWKEDRQRMSIEQYNREIEEADAAIDRGEFYTQDEVEKLSKKW